jgi:trehalose/maltose hydrolase-like predicted phosphorylase
MSKRTVEDWKVIYEGWDPEDEPLREALCTLGNGTFATRGAGAEARAGDHRYPGTYLARGYDRQTTEIAGRLVENESLVNWPNWLSLSLRPEGGAWFGPEDVELLDYRQELDLASGVLTRHVRWRDRQDRETRLVARRLVSMRDPHQAALCWEITPLNWSGAVEIRSGIDGSVTNTGVARYRQLASRHLEILDASLAGEDLVSLLTRTLQSNIVVAQAARTRVVADGAPAAVERETRANEASVHQHIVAQCGKLETLRVEKTLALYSSKDNAVSEPLLEACRSAHDAADFEQLLADHRDAWNQLWSRADIRLGKGAGAAQGVLRLYIFHLLQTTSIHTIDIDAGVPSRGLHGEAYRGHIFWDELFIFPFLNLSIPELTRALLMYRYRRLPAARRHARESGCAGALFPWQSGSNGREESQVVHLNPRSGRWLPDTTHRQRHINAAIAWNAWSYYQITGDREFLSFYGAEMILEIARCWADIATWNPERERYEIRQVVGPDEFHTQFPGRDEPGIDNNAYTNVVAAWCLRCGLATLDALAEDRRAELMAQLGIEHEELVRWENVGRRLFVPFDEDGLILQFEGFDRLEELDWDGLRERHDDVRRLDRVLEAEDDDVNRYKATKQADVLMLFYLFSAEELCDLLGWMGYEFDAGRIPDHIHYYLERTSHGSTLSSVVHAWVTARSMRERSWPLFERALASDIDDVQGGTTPEGIHLGAMAGTVDLVQRCYAGLEARDGVLWLNPRLPDALSELQMEVRYRGHWLAVRVTQEQIEVRFRKSWSHSARIGFRDEVHEMNQGEERVFRL